MQYLQTILGDHIYSKMKKWILDNNLLIIVSLSIISRLPQLLSPNLILDGDECIVGMMAKHFSEGKDVPYFFYGQSYGFSLVEVLVISLFYRIVENSDIAIKVSMLFLWILGIIFFYKTIKQIEPKNNDWSSILAISLFILSPAWAIWSMKARGGYITSFVLSSFTTFMLFHKRLNKSFYRLFLIGFFVVVIYQAQPLWLAGLIPILCYRLYKLKQTRSVILVCTGMTISMLLFLFIKADLSSFWSPKVLSLYSITFSSILKIPNQIYQNLTGSYYLDNFFQPILVTRILAYISTIFIFIGLGLAFFNFIQGKKVNPLFYVFSISVLCTICYPLILNGVSPRYLLPLYGYTFLMMYTLIVNSKKKTILNIILLFMIFLGGISMYSFKDANFENTNKNKLLTLIDELESRNINYVYVKNGLLQWQIMFYSNEQILARYKSKTSRYPEYIDIVDSALNNPETEVAMVGPISPMDEPTLSNNIILVENRYFIYVKPDKSVLMDNGFKFKKRQ